MNLPDKPPASLQQTDLVAALLPAAVELLEKDFREAGIEAQLSGKIFGDVFDLRELVAEWVKKTGGPGAEPFYRLLYRADVPESRVRETLGASTLPLEQAIAELLIIRALQRSFYRLKYRS